MTPDISAYLQFQFWEQILYLDHVNEFGGSVGRITDYQHENVTTDVWPTYNSKNDKSNGKMVSDVTELLKYMFILNEDDETNKQRPSLQLPTTVTIFSEERMV